MISALSRLLPPVVLRSSPAPFLDGALVLGRDGQTLDVEKDDALVVGTIRMGYGHYRMARAAITWGLRAGGRVLVHDPLAVASFESSVLHAGERAYSECSRLSAELGGLAEKAWGRVTRSGGRESQAASRLLARGLERLMGGLPRDWPVVCAHPWNAHLAVVCGFKRVINLVPDSCPQRFFVVPEAINLAQNEESRAALLDLGASSQTTMTAGHWVPAELAENAARDSEARLRRLARAAPLRLLLSIGGAGAQLGYLQDFLARLAPPARAGRLRLLINAGDHSLLAERLERALKAASLSVARLDASRDLDEFLARHPLAGAEPEAEATLVEARGPLEAVTATDRLMRAADALATKPSELAFFPLPKLHLRRVGDHEAPAAVYSAALGDGTLERREPGQAAAQVEQWLHDPESLARLNEGVIQAAARGVYDGAKIAVERALTSS